MRVTKIDFEVLKKKIKITAPELNIAFDILKIQLEIVHFLLVDILQKC